MPRDAAAPAVAKTVSWVVNAATRSADRFDAAWQAQDWSRVAALFAPGYHEHDRQPMVHVDLDRERFLDGLSLAFGMQASWHSREVLATRGDRLALFRVKFGGSGGAHLAGGGSVGPTETEWLGLVEVDERGQRIVGIKFDRDDIDGAHTELTARYAAGEGASYQRVSTVMRAFGNAFAARDWNRLAELFAPDLVVNDHRLLGWEQLRGPEAYVRAMRSMTDLASDVRLRADHVAMSERAYIAITTWVGSHEGGAFETPSFVVAELDYGGRIRRIDQYDIDGRDEAQTRFDAIANTELASTIAARSFPAQR